jgi:hypothetical protein
VPAIARLRRKCGKWRDIGFDNLKVIFETIRPWGEDFSFKIHINDRNVNALK